MSLARRFSPLLLTGGSGFVGSCAIRRALADGFEVHALVRPHSRLWRLEGVVDRLHLHRGDLTDAAAVREAFERGRPRAVLHLGTHGAYEAQHEARQILNTNIVGTYNVLEEASRSGTAVVVNTGSSSEYGYRDTAMRESDSLAPNSVYAVAKAAQTHLCSLLNGGARGPAVVTLRLFSVYGPWEEPSRLIPTVIRRAAAGEPLEMVSPSIARDFVFVDDVLDALFALDRLADLGGEVLNIGSGKQSTLADVVEAVRNAMNCSVEVRWGAMPARRWDSNCWRADVSKARQLLGWSPRYSLEEGIAATAAWMRSPEVRPGAA